MMERKLNKWRYGIRFGKCPPWQLGFHPYIHMWFLKFHSFPPVGEMFTKKHYKGFYFDWRMPALIVEVRTFRNPFKFGKRYYVLPIKIVGFSKL